MSTRIGHQTSRPPFVGALLRLCWQRVRRHMYDAIQDAGFGDLDEAHFAVFAYPLPQGMRASDLARQLRMSRQATNYLVGQLERLGYLERRAGPDNGRRLIFMTDRGWRVADVIYASLRQLQKQWAEEIGNQRFHNFLEVLKFLSKEG